MKQLLYLLVFLSLFSSCAEEKRALPIPEEELIGILADLHIAEAGYQTLSKELKDSLSAVYFEQVYEMHGTEQAKVDSCISILAHDPARMAELYKKVQKKLEVEEK